MSCSNIRPRATIGAVSTLATQVFRDAVGLLRHHPVEGRLRADDALDSTRAMLVWEPRRIVCSYAVPEADIRDRLTSASALPDPGDPVLHPGHPFAIHTAEGDAVDVGDRPAAGFRLADPDLAGYVVLDFNAFAWLEEDEELVGHPRDPFHRVDVRRSSRRVQIEVDGTMVADTIAPRMLFETNLPTRFYLPAGDVHGLEPSDHRSTCAYKGHASYWSLPGQPNIAWTYESPVPEALAIKGLVAFYNERVQTIVDGERIGAGDTTFTDEMVKESLAQGSQRAFDAGVTDPARTARGRCRE